MNTIHPEAGKLTLFPYIVKTDLAGPDSERHRILAEIGRLLVPERRSNPDSRLIELTFVRLKSTAPQPGPPLVFLTGGPGRSGIDALRWERLYPWFTALRQVGDVIALDQLIVEGVAHSPTMIVQAPGITSAILDFLRGQPVTVTQSSLPFIFSHKSEKE